MRLRNSDAAYLAGLIDGEGCIFINKNGRYFHAGLAVNMTTSSLPTWAKRVTKVGQVRKKKSSNKKHRDSWRWTVWSNEASKLLREILPYLKLKKPHALNLMAFQNSHNSAHYRTARTLNRRGR